MKIVMLQKSQQLSHSRGQLCIILAQLHVVYSKNDSKFYYCLRCAIKQLSLKRSVAKGRARPSKHTGIVIPYQNKDRAPKKFMIYDVWRGLFMILSVERLLVYLRKTDNIVEVIQ